ncbi:BCCT family transporter [Azohydromonas lata]|uniref:BCCT family transporter n=1 Tax=Azohydromonas lata TaxID=45677 RepID=A0ABU5IB37_9BURK|nr:BCCT family transporter [Azohydromonas lata]MDZ5456327.1 BCCT family transporter [Azohydromonas lata]
MDAKVSARIKTRPPHRSAVASNENIQILGLDVHRIVCPAAVLMIVALVIYSVSDPASAGHFLNKAKDWTIVNFDWFYIIAGNAFVAFCLLLVLSPAGNVRIGRGETRPEYGIVSYFSMLFAAGMGVGLLFWGVAEPLAYYTGWSHTPLNVPKETPEAVHAAMGATLFHWGLHPWAVYCIVALIIGYFAYNRGLQNSLRSGLEPLIGAAHKGWIGHVVDIFTILLTTFGLSTSLGLGAMQAAAGMHHVFGTPNSFAMQAGFIVFVSVLSALGVGAGMHAGIKLLSNINMALALGLLIFVIIGAGVVSFIAGLGSSTADYAEYFIPLANWAGRKDSEWFRGWTVFYWAWWASWAPFVGMFIASISRGRTVRQIVISVMIAPTLVALLWMTAFGGAAIHQAESGVGELAGGIKDVTLTLFWFLEALPFAQLTSFLAVILLAIFMVTSVNSGCLVVDTLASGGKETTSGFQKVVWAAVVGVVTLVLFIVGGDDALKAAQAGAIALGLPFMALMFVLMLGLFKALIGEHKKRAW